ncbi:alpha/beta fold hydrolase [Altererythrobacter sp. GH1-8]|uniref:alpha/beta fold hydrolase n=1 Tax=Altererythrobacter sp. GH1-8 TaxID=3349333 RepID=UPI00374D6CB2
MKALFALFLAAMFHGAALAGSVKDLAVHSTVQGQGQTIIFVHGWTCDSRSWREQTPAFIDDYRVVTIDLPGHGASQEPASVEDYSMELFADAVEAVRSELSANKIVLVGHSMGAAVIRAYALKYPDHVAGLVAVDGHLEQRGWTKIDPPTEPVTRATRAALIEGMFAEGTSEALRRDIRAMMMAAPATTAQGAFNAMASPDNQSTQVIEAPALTVWASDSRQDPDFDTRDFIPNWNETRLPDTGHFLMMEQPEKFNAILRDFLLQRARF